VLTIRVFSAVHNISASLMNFMFFSGDQPFVFVFLSLFCDHVHWQIKW